MLSLQACCATPSPLVPMLTWSHDYVLVSSNCMYYDQTVLWHSFVPHVALLLWAPEGVGYIRVLDSYWSTYILIVLVHINWRDVACRDDMTISEEGMTWSCFSWS